MRWLRLLAMALILSSTGCSNLIAFSGTRIDNLGTREEVEATLGKPSEVREEGGKIQASYFTHRKVAAPETSGIYRAMELGSTWGFSEFVMVPKELWLMSKRTILGQDIRAIYNEKGQVLEVFYERNSMVKYAPSEPESIPPKVPVRGVDQSGGQDGD